MNIYSVKINGKNDSMERNYTTNNFEQLLEWVREDLEDCGGGRASIYKEVSSLAFVENVEV